MVPIEMRLKAERRMRQLLAEDRKAQPDIVQYGDSRILLYWHGSEHAVIVSITDDGEIAESRLGEPPIGAGMPAEPEADGDGLHNDDDLELF